MNKEEMNRWVIVVATPPGVLDLHMVSVDAKHTGEEVAQGWAQMHKDVTKESKVVVFPAEQFCEMLRRRGDDESMELATKVEETFEIEPEIMVPPSSMDKIHDDQGIPENGQEAG